MRQVVRFLLFFICEVRMMVNLALLELISCKRSDLDLHQLPASVDQQHRIVIRAWYRN